MRGQIYAADESPARMAEAGDLPLHRHLDFMAAVRANGRARERSGSNLDACIAAGICDARRLRADAFRHAFRRLIRFPVSCLRALTDA